jgi:hypothetical protein
VHYGKNLRTTKFLKVADQREAEAIFLNSGPAEADYGKHSGCLPMPMIDTISKKSNKLNQWIDANDNQHD